MSSTAGSADMSTPKMMASPALHDRRGLGSLDLGKSPIFSALAAHGFPVNTSGATGTGPSPLSADNNDDDHSSFGSDTASNPRSSITSIQSAFNNYQLPAPGTAEHARLMLEGNKIRGSQWRKWGPYTSERQWATVREDYSDNGDAWSHFPHEQARSRAYRWGEDGLAGFSDDKGLLNWSLGLWNGKDSILKERLFGVTGHEGNHGEDCKELYYYLDSTPTHSYMKFLYKYPQNEYPYQDLVEKSGQRSRDEDEFEIMDTGLFADNRYWDVEVEYAKDEEDPEAISIRVTAHNRGPEPASLHIIPQLVFRNTWSWDLPAPPRPSLSASSDSNNTVEIEHDTLGKRYFHCLPSEGGQNPELMFTENDTNYEKLWGGNNATPYVKDAFHNHVIQGSEPDSEDSFINPAKTGTKSGAHYVFENVPAGGSAVVRVKLTRSANGSEDGCVVDQRAFDETIEARKAEADEFYASLDRDAALSGDLENINRQALAGMLWSKQYYEFDQQKWSKGDAAQPPPPENRKFIRNQSWKHLHVADVLSMPDKWEYPFFAAWDSAFHCIPLAIVDPAFAKDQLKLFTREWYMKADGEIPAYEWNFSDVNPPVHAWATFRVFKIERQINGGVGDIEFLKVMFLKLMINFTWWVNRKDRDGKNVFEGGFLGLDNIGAFNRSEALPNGGVLRQADGTAWMAFYCLNMLSMALELSKHDSSFEDIASKYFEHFIAISDAMTFNSDDGVETSLWNEEEGFYFDAVQWPGAAQPQQIPVRSLVGLIPLFATLTLEPDTLDRFPEFRDRVARFINARPEVSRRNLTVDGEGERILLSLASKDRLVRILDKMLDEDEFLSEHGIRSLSKFHKDHPFNMNVNGEDFGVGYWPGDSKSGMFGGNSNWRGPIWLATNFLLIESLQRFHQYYGNTLQVECPTGSGKVMHLANVAKDIQNRNIGIFQRGTDGKRPTNGGDAKWDEDAHFKDLVLFHEFFHADNGRGLGASHQTGWTGLVSYHILQTAEVGATPHTPKAFASHYFQESYSYVKDDEDDLAEELFANDYSLRPSLSVASMLHDISPDAL